MQSLLWKVMYVIDFHVNVCFSGDGASHVGKRIGSLKSRSCVLESENAMPCTWGMYKLMSSLNRKKY